MRKSLPTFLALCCLSATAEAVDWIYDADKGGFGNVTFSASLGTSDTDGSWYYLDGQGERVYIRNSYSESDTFSIGSTDLASNISLTLDTDLTCAGFNFTSSASGIVNVIGASNSIKLTVNGDIINGTTAQVNSRLQNLNVYVSGDFNPGKFWNGIQDASKIYVGGDIDGNNTQPHFSVALEGSDISNPDMIVGGIMTNSTWSSFFGSSKDVYYQVGGFSNMGLIRVFNSSNENYITNFVFTNAAGTNYASANNSNLVEVFGNHSNDMHISVNPLNRSRARIIMNGEGTQTFGYASNGGSGSEMVFSGGVVVNSGTLRIKFAQTASAYTYNATYQKDSTDAAATYAVTYWDSDGQGAAQTSSSHGDLEINGGTFASLEGDSEYTFGAFRFTNIIYKGGKIALRISSSENVNDSIDLTSYYMREVNTEDESLVYYTKENGGTVKLADGAAAGTKVTFEFSGDILGWLLDYENGSFDINGGKGAKIVSWDAENKTALSASDFAGNWITQGDDYMPVFTVADDGLYVRYTVVPEPAEVAAILGALALAAAALHRRNRN